MSFLIAEWRKLAFANYEVSPDLLAPYVPAGTELDLWEGKCYLSLVGFMFLNTRLLGISIPFHINFEEVNIRFYVKRFDGTVWKRGVVFIKEIVPKHALTLVANTVYNEHYETLPMNHTWGENKQEQSVDYRWKKGGIWHNFQVTAVLAPSSIASGSVSEFITEHYWGYSKKSQITTTEYEVTHPKWQQYEVLSHQIQVDFGKVYGNDFQFLNKENPTSVMLAEGSAITVEGKKTLRLDR